MSLTILLLALIVIVPALDLLVERPLVVIRLMTVAAAALFVMYAPVKSAEIDDKCASWNFRVQPDYSADGPPARGNTCAVIYTMKDTGKTIPCLTSPIVHCVSKMFPPRLNSSGQRNLSTAQ